MTMTKEELQFEKMTKTPVKRLVLSLGLPTTITMLVTTIYNIADTAFVSHISTAASGAVSIIFPVMAFIQAFGFLFGMGAGTSISAKLGSKKNDVAQRIGSNTFYLALVFGILLGVIGLIFINPLMYLLGSTDSIFPHAKDYALYILIGAPIMICSCVLNIMLRSEGKAKFAMIGITTGALLNIGLDPLFIFAFNLGTKGAAIATLIGQTISLCILLSFFIRKKSIITLSPKNIHYTWDEMLDVFKVGLPSLCRQGLASFATIILNNQAKLYGSDAAISALGITSKIFMVTFAITIGIGQGYQPVAGYNNASKNYRRVKEALLFTLITSISFMVVLCSLLIIFADKIFYIFLSDPEVIEIGKVAVTYQAIIFPFLSLNAMANMTFQSLHKKFRAVLLSCCRQGIFYIPLVFILPKHLGIFGLEITQALADLCTILFTIPFFVGFIKYINGKIKEQDELNKKMQLNK